jgi:hypothetical protein
MSAQISSKVSVVFSSFGLVAVKTPNNVAGGVGGISAADVLGFGASTVAAAGIRTAAD